MITDPPPSPKTGPSPRSKPRIVVISPSPLATDPRVYRQLQLLQPISQLTAAGFTDPEIEGVEFVPLALSAADRASRWSRVIRLATKRFDRYYDSIPWVRKARAALRTRPFDVVIANDAESWPLGIEIRGHGRVLFDAHEYAPREFEDVWWWRLIHQPYKLDLCRRFIPRADGMMTVCQGIADEYARCFGRKPLVVMNAPPRRAATPIRCGENQVRLIHHGAAIPSRRIESMIDVVDRLDDRFRLDLMLTPNDPHYLRSLENLIRSRPRVRLRPPVPMQQIPEEIRDYDVGLFLLEPTNFNYRHALPNKFFEFIQARLAIAIGPSPEMASLVRRFRCGIVATDFRPASLAGELNALTRDTILQLKQNADQAAQMLCWEHESGILLREVERLLSLGPCAA